MDMYTFFDVNTQAPGHGRRGQMVNDYSLLNRFSKSPIVVCGGPFVLGAPSQQLHFGYRNGIGPTKQINSSKGIIVRLL